MLAVKKCWEPYAKWPGRMTVKVHLLEKILKDNSGKFVLPPPSFSTNRLKSLHLTL